MAKTQKLAAAPLELRLENGALSLGVENIELLSSAALANATHEQLTPSTVVLGFSSDTPTHLKDVHLGPVKCLRFMACARNKLWWMTPEWGTTMSELPTETQFLLLQHGRKGPYTAILPLITRSGFRATLKADRNKALKPLSEDLVLRIESGAQDVTGSAWPAALLVASGRNIFELIDHAVTQAAALSGTTKPLRDKHLPDSLNYFGWCTWDAFYSTVSAEGVQAGLRSLHAGGITPRTLIIDDGWQMTQVDEDHEGARKVSKKRPIFGLSGFRDEPDKSFSESRDEEFAESEQAVLAAYADALPGGAELMNTMPALSDPDYSAALREHLRSRDKDGDPEAEKLLARLDRLKKRANLEAPQIERTVLELARKPQERALWSRLAQRLGGWAAGVANVLFLVFYQFVVDPAGPHAWPVPFFRYLATKPLKGSMLNFFAVSGDFTKRVISVRANGKFSRPDANADDGKWFSEPEDFRTVTNHLRREFGISYILCWHGLPAYWGGIMPESPEFEDLEPQRVYPVPTPGLREIEPAMLWNPAVVAGIGVVGNSDELYTRMHRYLAAAGVDGVKVDCQAGVGLVGSVTGGGAVMAKRYHASLEESISRHFPGNHAINCMCHSTENLYQMRDTAIVRASDDFYPREEASSHPHIAACAYNSLFFGPLFQPDWDMFQSLHPAARLHACARAVSGGAVYVSDKVGKHDYAILRQLVLRDGTVLRAARPGLPTEDSIFCDPLRDDKSLLKIWTTNAYTGMVGAFNVQGAFWDRVRRRFSKTSGQLRRLAAGVSPWDVAEMQALVDTALPAPWVGAFASLTNTSRAVRVLDGLHGEQSVALNPGGADIITFAPLVEGPGGVRFGALGLSNMLNSGGAIAGFALERRTFAIELLGEGEFVASSSAAPQGVEVDGTPLKRGTSGWAWDAGRLSVEVVAGHRTSVKHSVRITF